MERQIKSGDQLKEWFFTVRKRHDVQEIWEKGVFVDGRVRKELLTDECQGKTTIDGRVRRIEFENMGGGVYRAFLAA